jgi:uncharacterized protein (UPF0332 family)
MINHETPLTIKTYESLAGAKSEFANGRYNNCANRCYYACFHAAIAAMEEHGLIPHTGRGRTTWSHDALQATFAGELIHRRKRYPSELRDTLTRTASLREAADYTQDFISETQAARALRRTRIFVDTIFQRRGGEQQ